MVCFSMRPFANGARCEFSAVGAVGYAGKVHMEFTRLTL